MFHRLYTCCLPQKMKKDPQYLNEDWSSTVLLYKNQNLSKSYPLNLPSITKSTDDYCIYTLPTVCILPNFSDLFRSAYQKCLYGSLTSIPRPLKEQM